MRVRFQDLSEYERSLICNGCGPKAGGLPVPDFFWSASCDHHDFNYWLGCTRRDRLKADRQFYAAMRVDAAGRPLFLIVALGYYLAVRLCGWPSFHYADRMRDSTDLIRELKEILGSDK